MKRVVFALGLVLGASAPAAFGQFYIYGTDGVRTGAVGYLEITGYASSTMTNVGGQRWWRLELGGGGGGTNSFAVSGGLLTLTVAGNDITHGLTTATVRNAVAAITNGLISSVTGPGMTNVGGAVTFSTNGWVFGSAGNGYTNELGTAGGFYIAVTNGLVEAIAYSPVLYSGGNTGLMHDGAWAFAPAGVSNVLASAGGSVSLVGPTNQPVLYIKGLSGVSPIQITDQGGFASVSINPSPYNPTNLTSVVPFTRLPASIGTNVVGGGTWSYDSANRTWAFLPNDLAGDVVGNPVSNTVVALQNRTLPTAPPSVGDILRYSPAGWEYAPLTGVVSSIAITNMQLYADGVQFSPESLASDASYVWPDPWRIISLATTNSVAVYRGFAPVFWPQTTNPVLRVWATAPAAVTVTVRVESASIASGAPMPNTYNLLADVPLGVSVASNAYAFSEVASTNVVAGAPYLLRMRPLNNGVVWIMSVTLEAQ